MYDEDDGTYRNGAGFPTIIRRPAGGGRVIIEIPTISGRQQFRSGNSAISEFEVPVHYELNTTKYISRNVMLFTAWTSLKPISQCCVRARCGQKHLLCCAVALSGHEINDSKHDGPVTVEGYVNLRQQ